MMRKKLELNVEDLAVESFAASTEPELRGTVQGAQDSYDFTACPRTECPSGCLTCDPADCTNGGGTTGTTGGGTSGTPVGTLAGPTCGAACNPSPTIE
jgi:hypothetical protein